MKFVKRLWAKCLSYKKLCQKYLQAGGQFGEAVSYLYMGECVGFEQLLDEWSFWEQEYLRRGFASLSLDDFIRYGGYGENMSVKLGHKNPENPISHAEIYRRKYLGKIQPLIDPMANKIQMAEYVLPSTENLEEE